MYRYFLTGCFGHKRGKSASASAKRASPDWSQGGLNMEFDDAHFPEFLAMRIKPWLPLDCGTFDSVGRQ